MDAQDEVVPDAVVTLKGVEAGDDQEAVANDRGSFQFAGLRPGTPYHLAIKANGFADWTSDSIVLTPGQYDFLTNIKLVLEAGAASVTVSSSPTEIAAEDLKVEEQQRVFGLIPNFYVAYDPNAPPLTAKMKFKLAWKVSTDPVTFAGVLFLAGINQGVELPDYALGAKGYGERVGAVAADGISDIMIGGAILPSLLHQDPRYFYKGTGTIRSRMMHALANPFVCRGDNERWQPNYSTIGGDVASSALSNLYYPRRDRTPGILFENVSISTLERTASSLTQEFVLHRFTFGSRNKN